MNAPKKTLIVLLCFLALLTIPYVARAATITSTTLDKNTYLAGETGYISVSIYNDKSEKIRVTELTATMNYYYADGTVYVQKFFTNATLPDEITPGQTETHKIPISLPTNIASGYINPRIQAGTEVWQPQTQRWTYSDWPTYNSLKLYIESPYKQSYESSQHQLQEQTATNLNLTNTVNMLAVTTVVFASTAAFVMFLLFTRRPRPVT